MRHTEVTHSSLLPLKENQLTNPPNIYSSKTMKSIQCSTKFPCTLWKQKSVICKLGLSLAPLLSTAATTSLMQPFMTIFNNHGAIMHSFRTSILIMQLSPSSILTYASISLQNAIIPFNNCYLKPYIFQDTLSLLHSFLLPLSLGKRYNNCLPLSFGTCSCLNAWSRIKIHQFYDCTLTTLYDFWGYSIYIRSLTTHEPGYWFLHFLSVSLCRSLLSNCLHVHTWQMLSQLLPHSSNAGNVTSILLASPPYFFLEELYPLSSLSYKCNIGRLARSKWHNHFPQQKLWWIAIFFLVS